MFNDMFQRFISRIKTAGGQIEHLWLFLKSSVHVINKYRCSLYPASSDPLARLITRHLPAARAPKLIVIYVIDFTARHRCHQSDILNKLHSFSA